MSSPPNDTINETPAAPDRFVRIGGLGGGLVSLMSLPSSNKGGLRRLSSNLDNDNKTISDIVLLPLPGLIGFPTPPFQYNNRIIINAFGPEHQADPVRSYILPTVNKTLIDEGCDFDFQANKCKWKGTLSSYGFYTTFIVQVFLAAPDVYLLECSRREGDGMPFGHLWRSIRESFGLFSNHTALTPGDHASYPVCPVSSTEHSSTEHSSTEHSATRPHLPIEACRTAAHFVPPRSVEIDDKCLTVLFNMVSSGSIYDLWTASCTIVRLVSSGSSDNSLSGLAGLAERRRVLSSSLLLACLVKAVHDLDTSGANPLPYHDAIMTHSLSTLASVSEEPLCHYKLLEAGALSLCFQLVGGTLSPTTDGEDQSQPTPLYVCHRNVKSRRDAARCLANVLSTWECRDSAVAALQSCGSEIRKWGELVGELKDDKLRMQCERVWKIVK